MAAASAKAALDDITVLADEQALIRLQKSGGIEHDEFPRRAQTLAQRKAVRGDG